MTNRRRPTRRAPARSRRIPTIAETNRRRRRTINTTRLIIAGAGPLFVYSWWVWGASTQALMIGVGLIVFTVLSARWIRRTIIVCLACVGLYVLRAIVCRYRVFPNGPGRIDDPAAPWRRYLGIQP